MPCHDWGDFGDSRSNAEAARAWNHLSLVIQHLCYVCSRIERGDSWADVVRESPSLASWWDEHKSMDEQREKQMRVDAVREQLRSAAIAKLTPSERAALGLNRDI